MVFVGGAGGTAARAGIGLAVPAVAGIPLGTLGVNLLGAFLLGVLLEALARRGPDVGLRRALRLGLGTGVLGGFTTYSALAVETASLSLAAGALYLVTTVLVGALASAAGIAVGRRLP